jgi:hypothetical protein
MIQDQLNLTEISQDAKKQSRAMKWFAISFILMISLSLASFLITPALSNIKTHVFLENEAAPTGWQELKDLKGSPVDVQISPAGTVWVQTNNPDALNRWNGTTWRTYNDFRTEGDLSIRSFVLDDTNVWVAMDGSIAHFDSHDWEIFPDVIKDTPQAMTAGSAGLFVINCKGDISRYYAGEWTTSNVRDVLPGLESTDTYCAPRLMQTFNGTVWLEWYGIWKFNGDDWEPARIAKDTSTIGVRLVGANDYGVWTSWGPYGLIWTRSEFDGWYPYELEDLGISEQGRVSHVIDTPESFTAATNEGLIQLVDEKWERYISPQMSDAKPFHIAAFQDGRLWMTAQSGSNSASIPILILLLILMLLSTILMLITLIRLRRIQLGSSIKAREYLQKWIPELVQPKSQRLTKLVYIFWFVLLIAFGVFIALLPNFGANGIILFVLALMVTLIVGIGLWRKQVGNSVNTRRIILYAAPIIGLFLWFGVFSLGLALLSGANSLLTTPWFILWCSVFLAIILFPYYYAYRNPLSHGDYATAIKRMEQLRHVQPDRIQYMYYHGVILLMAQRYAEGEALLREAIIQIRNNQPLLQACILQGLGEALIGQGKYEEAVGVLELSIYLWPKLTTTYNSLVELYLEHGDNPARALELIEFAQKKGVLNTLTRWIEPFHASITSILQAWALAKLNRSDEADQAAAKTFQQRDKWKFNPATAAIYYLSARAKQAQGDVAAAREHFKQSIEIDPNGIYGLRSKQNLTADNLAS